MQKIITKHRNESTRLKNWDYGLRGFYFITICTKDREHYFGDVDDRHRTSVRHTKMGTIAHTYWLEIPQHFPFVQLDEFVVMPNHVHGLLFFNKPYIPEWKPNVFGPQSQNLASVIRGYKAAVKKYATMNDIEFAWQSRYHDSIVRTDDDLSRIRQYIKTNPAKWAIGQDIDVTSFYL